MDPTPKPVPHTADPKEVPPHIADSKNDSPKRGSILDFVRTVWAAVWAVLFPFWNQGVRGQELTHVQTVTILFALLGLVVMSRLGGDGQWAAAVMYGMAFLAAGTAVGFLFGFPKVRQAGAPRREPSPDATDHPADPKKAGSEPADPTYQMSVNTNLEDVSDWLTKIIVGVTLVEAKSLLDAANQLAAHMDEHLVLKGGQPAAGAAIVYFSVVGFFYGYLITRLFLSESFRRADRETTSRTGDRLVRAEQSGAPSADGASPPPVPKPS